MIKWIYYESKLWWFLFLVTSTIFSAWLNQTYVLTDTIYYNTYGEQFSMETIESMIESARRYSWIAYIAVFGIIIIRVLFTSICLYFAVFFKDMKESFETCFNIALKADAIFLVALLFNLLYQGLVSSRDLIELSSNPV